jgi:putative NADPH-quinone reductase
MRKVLVILGHPRTDSFGGALADTYVTSAKQAGHDTREIRLGDLRFDPVLHQGYKGEQALEPDLQAAQADLRWADEIVFVFPIWWGGLPAQLKGFLDRVLLPGFAFRYEGGGKLPVALLKGRTARLIITMDTPRWIDRWLYGSPALRQLKYPILRFCGIRLTRTVFLAPVIQSDPRQREAWMAKVRRLALS